MCRVPLRPIATAVLVSLLLSACWVGPKTYSAQSITASVFDKDTGQPIPQVRVVAAWELKGGLEGGSVLGYLTVMETVTDADGRFSFPQWGPKTYRGPGGIGWGAPWLVFFRPGYYPEVLENQRNPPATGALRSDWDGKRISLTQSPEGLREYSTHFQVIDSFIQSLAKDERCEWQHAAGLIRALQAENDQLLRATAVQPMANFTRLNSLAADCGSLQTYIESHGQ